MDPKYLSSKDYDKHMHKDYDHHKDYHGGEGKGGGGSRKIYSGGSDFCKHYDCGLCEGDCDSHDDCKGDLMCFQRKAGKSVPGCSGGSSDHSGESIFV